MYLRILKKDLKRKKTMNLIMLVFIILAATFIAGSTNNMVSVMTALDCYFEKAEVPDYWIATAYQKDAERFVNFLKENDYNFRQQEMIQIDPAEIKINSGKFEYSNSVAISQLKNSIKIFDKNDKEITQINDGEIYLTAEIFYSSKYNIKAGDKIEITANGKTKTFTVKGSTKDALFGSSMIGMTRFLVSQNDYEFFNTENTGGYYYVTCIYTDDAEFMDKYCALELNLILSVNYDGIKTMYIMDLLTAAVMLVVSVCLILISMVILRFTINFTMSEEFREIGVMKAVGIKNRKIRGLYIIKYFAISVIGGIIGLILSIPFGKLMLGNLSDNIILSGDGNYFLNVICSAAVVFAVVLFCYFCTRKVKSFSPIDAIRNGETGERYSRKGFIHLSKSRLSPVLFLAVNDILSGIKRFVVMILIFTLGLLLIIIPVNAINTLKSDQLITLFSMAECDHVLSREQLLNTNSNNRQMLYENLDDIRRMLQEHGIYAEIFEEIMFRMNISYQGKRASSLAFQGIGDITADKYVYLEGTPPQNNDEAAISYLIADHLGVKIGDTVKIKNGEETKEYMITAIYQTMNNMGEGIRFYQEEQLDYNYAGGSFGIQIAYQDNPDNDELARRKELLKELFPDYKVFTAGEYISIMIGDIAGQLQGVKHLILLVVLFVNILVTVLMMKSFLIKEKGEIAMLKAIGFKNSSLIAWQTLRIGMVLCISAFIGVLLGTPLSEIAVGPVFQIMGAKSIKLYVKPLEIYLIYPFVILCVTVLTSLLTTFQIRKISASETSNIE